MKTNPNKIHLLTTLSVYIGLVLVGSSPQVLAQAKTASGAHTHQFEVNVKTNNVFAKLKIQTRIETEDIIPFETVARRERKDSVRTADLKGYRGKYGEIRSENDQVSVVTNLPRASI